MLPSLQETLAMYNQDADRSDANFGNRRRAARQFRQAFGRGLRRKMWGQIAGREQQLEDLKTALGKVEVKVRHYAGVRVVPLEKIQGSEGRSRDFDDEFNPTRLENEDRWIGVATAARMGAVLPPVDLIQLGEAYFVRDGHHRISVARALGQKEIDAQVTVWEV